jgi:hypothetical protein
MQMENARRFHRPAFEDALEAWKVVLKSRALSTDILWVLDENLCFERDTNAMEGLRLGFQTQFVSPPADAAKVTYHHFAEVAARLVFYRLGANRGRSICIQLCDPWFESRHESEGYIRHDDWLLSFFPGNEQEIEEITDAGRWKERIVRGRPLTAVDFCMTLAALRELKAHGRVLTPDERFGLKILRSMERARA